MAHTRGANVQIPALKPALILINYLGYPSTSGGSFYDYAMVDCVVAPPEAAMHSWTERLIYLPRSYQANNYHLDVDIDLDFDLDVKGNMAICNFNTIDKIEPSSFSSWMNLLQSLPGSTLHLLSPSASSLPLSSTIVSNLLLEANSRGIHASKRIIFEPRLDHSAHIERISSMCDVYVDSFVYGGHTTVSDFLWAGVPSFTVGGWGAGGETSAGGMPGRVGRSLIGGLDHGGYGGVGYVTDTVKALESNLISIGSNLAVLRLLRSDILKRIVTGSTFDTQGIVNDIERVYHAVWEVFNLKNQKKMHIMVAPGFALTALELKEKRVAILNKAMDSLNSSSKPGAAAITKRFVSAFPSDPDAWHLFGLANKNAAGIEKAIQLLLPHEVPAFFYTNLAAVQLDAGNVEKAIESFLRAIEVEAVGQIVAGSAYSAVQLGGGGEAFRRICQASDQVLELCGLARDRRWGEIELTLEESLNNEFPKQLAILFAFHGSKIINTEPYFALSLLKIATVLSPKDWEIGLKFAAGLEQIEGGSALVVFFHNVVVMHEKKFKNSDTKADCKNENENENEHNKRTTIAIYCNEYGQTWWPNWGPTSVETGGVGGSEEAVIFLSRSLANLGFTVYVYADPNPSSLGPDPVNSNVVWRHYDSYDVENPPDVFVAWRYHISLALALALDFKKNRPKKVFLWLQVSERSAGGGGLLEERKRATT